MPPIILELSRVGQVLKIACLEVIACKMEYITKQQLLQLAEHLKKNGYGQYLIQRAKEFS